MARHIYFHIPFCAAKCPYCSFYSVADHKCIPMYKEAAMKELTAYDLLIKRGILPDNNDSSDERDTIYFGGGTPSVPDADVVCDFLKEAIRIWNIKDDAEITIEVNPFSFTLDKARAYKEAGFNRVSIGVQSLSDEVLKTLGRLHDRRKAIEAIDIAKKAGFTNISGDLIIGVPGQTYEQVIKEAQELIASGVKHISMYSLSIEEGTPFHERYSKTLEDLISQETEREMYHGLRDYLKSNGIIPYEISNCAMPGYNSAHNTSYWEGREYVAIGAGSHGYLNSKRFGHADDVDTYIKDMLNMKVEDIADKILNPDDQSIYLEEELTEEEKMREYAMLMLRTSAGIDKKIFKDKYCLDFDSIYKEELKANKIKGFLTDDGQKVSLTRAGLDFANQVFADFI